MATRPPNWDSTVVWRKSSASGINGGCVEVATFESSVLVRDSRNQAEVILEFGQVQWRGFMGRIRNGDAISGTPGSYC